MRKLVLAAVAAGILSIAAIAIAAAHDDHSSGQWPTSCVDLNDIVEEHLGRTGNVGIYQRTFGEQAEAACRNDHRNDVIAVFGWAIATETGGPAEAADLELDWPTTCVELNDIVEGHLGNQGNVAIYQNTFGDQAEAACQNDHRNDVRSVFAWAIGGGGPAVDALELYDDETLTNRQAILDACEPEWDPADPRIVTWNARTLHDEPYQVRDIFYREWGGDDLVAGQHLRRWRWEYECLHPAPRDYAPPGSGGGVDPPASAPSSSQSSRPSPSRSSPSPSSRPSPSLPVVEPSSALRDSWQGFTNWADLCLAFLNRDPSVQPTGAYASGSQNEFLNHPDPATFEQCQRRPPRG